VHWYVSIDGLGINRPIANIPQQSGLSTAGGSVTLGLIADLYEPDEQQFPLAFIVLSSCIGTSIGGVIGGPIERFLHWRWNFWIQLIFNGGAQAIHFFMPESRATIILDKEAKRRRKTGEDPNIYGPNELKSPRISIKELGTIWMRPWIMLVTEPIVLCLSLLSGFSDALIFTFLESFKPVYEQWGFGTLAIAWAFIPINLAYFIAYFSYYPWFWRDNHHRNKTGSMLPERRLKWLLWTAPLEPIGLFAFAWTTQGPQVTHWIVPMIFSTFIGIANYTIYFSSVDYMVAAYGVYSASATGGNAWARDFFAGICKFTLFSHIPSNTQITSLTIFSKTHSRNVRRAPLPQHRPLPQPGRQQRLDDPRRPLVPDRAAHLRLLLVRPADQGPQQFRQIALCAARGDGRPSGFQDKCYAGALG